MAAKHPLTDPAVPDGAVDGVNPANADAYKGFNFDMGTVNQNITCNSCHAGGGPAQFGREGKPLDEVLREKLGDSDFESLGEREWFVHDDALLSKTGVDGDLLGYSEYEVAAGYIGKPGIFNFKRSGVNDTDCFMCHADASQKEKTVHSKVGNADVYPIMPANPRVMVFKGLTSDNETIVISLGIPPKKGEVINGKTVEKVDSAYYNSVPVEVLAAVYRPDNVEEFVAGIVNGTDNRFFLYPNNANGATREVARVAYFEHPESTKDKDGGEVYVNGGAVTFKDDNGAVYRTFAGFFFKYISTASLMGVDTDQDGVPLAYVRFVKDGDIWKPEVYYDIDEFNSDGSVDLPILMSRGGDKNTLATELEPEDYAYSVPKRDENGNLIVNDNRPQMTTGEKNKEWGYVCSYCHMAIPYESGTLNTPQGQAHIYTWVTRKGTLGLGAEIVKRGDVFSYDIHRGGEEKGNLSPDEFVGIDFSNDTQKAQAFMKMLTAKSVVSFDDIPIGYDVHFDSEKGGMTCLSCHGEGTLTADEKEFHPVHHDFLKGNDWGGHWDQSLDYNPSLKTCVDCHFDGSRELAAEAHASAFGPEGNAGIHMEKVACEVCHIPYRTHWTFRAFYDVLGYSYNFDNRMLAYDFANGTTVRLPKSMFTPGFGPFMPIAGYGAPQPFPIARTENGKDVVVPIYQVDFDPRQAALRLEQNMFGIWKVPQESFPWGWATVIINNGFRPDEPGGQKFMYRIADPLTLVTWYDKSTGKVLYTREMAAALDGAVESPSAGKKVPAYFLHNNKVCVKTILGEYICDDNGDLMPEIDTDTEYEAMKAALEEVLRAEGVRNPEPVFYIWTAPFSIDHGVLPKEYALGAGATINGEKLDCSSCHDAQKGRLPQANMADINSSDSLSALIEKNPDGTIKFFGLGREIITVPVKIPAEAYREAVKVFFNTPENADGSPRYGTMTVGNNTVEVMTTTAGDILVNALSNGLDVDRHLVPIPVESTGIDGIAFAMPESAPDALKNKKWKMKFEGIPVEVETEVLHEGEIPRRAIVIRLKNELPELLGLENLAEEIMSAGEREGVEPVFTPVVLSHFIERLEFELADLGVTSVDNLYLNYAEIVKVRHSGEEGVVYEVDHEKFHPESISMEEAINRGWASYDAYSKKLSLNVAAIRSNVRAEGEGELAVSIMRSISGSVEIPEVREVSYSNSTTAVVELRSGQEVTIKVSGGASSLNVLGDEADEKAKVYEVVEKGKFSKVLPPVEVQTNGEFEVEFENVTLNIDKLTAKAFKEDGIEVRADIVDVNNGSVKVRVNPEEALTRASENVIVAVGEASAVPEATATSISGGGGGGCSVSPAASPASGFASLSLMLSGLLGLFGFRRKKH